jgi:glutathione S-transferase
MAQFEDTLYFTSGSCALASLAALEQTQRPYRAVRLEMRAEGAGDENFSALSPLRQVPVLVTSSGPLRETAAIFTYLSSLHPDAALLPSSGPDMVPAQRWLGFLGGTVHAAFRPLARPARFAGPELAIQAVVRDQGAAYLRRVVGALAGEMLGRRWVLSERSALDFYLHVFTRWLSEGESALPEPLARHHALVAALPAMTRAVAAEAQAPLVTS